MDVADRLLTDKEYFQFVNLVNDYNIYNKVFDFDVQLGGIGILNINDNETGRYDRDVFRPIQYIWAYLQMDIENIEWVTREIVHMCSLHFESLVKRLFMISKLPLGQALTMRVAPLKLDKQTIKDLRLLVQPYNQAKHHLLQEKDSQS